MMDFDQLSPFCESLLVNWKKDASEKERIAACFSNYYVYSSLNTVKQNEHFKMTCTTTQTSWKNELFTKAYHFTDMLPPAEEWWTKAN